jgi:DNA-binding Lrp family transcriptional regulator
MVEETEARPVIDANLLELVVKNMPPQPWPKGAHRAVAEKLGVSPSVVTKAIDILIERGIFKPQVEGKLFVPEKIG